MENIKPIAVLDSGAGGLSVVSALKKLYPKADIHYFADTANLPYGIKSPELIKTLSLSFAQKAVKLSSCRLLIIACHTISVTCLDEIRKTVGVPVIGMVEPSILALKELMEQKSVDKIGMISTKATALSGVYHQIGRKNLIEHAAGPLVSLVEDSDLKEEELISILRLFLPTSIKKCDALLIGCTHFSALIPALKKVLKPSCAIVDAADFLGLMLKSEPGMALGSGSLFVYVSDNPERFQITSRRFMDQTLTIRGC